MAYLLIFPAVPYTLKKIVKNKIHLGAKSEIDSKIKIRQLLKTIKH